MRSSATTWGSILRISSSSSAVITGSLSAHVAQIAAGIVAIQDFELLFVCGIAHFYLQEEAGRAAPRETIGAFLLHGFCVAMTR